MKRGSRSSKKGGNQGIHSSLKLSVEMRTPEDQVGVATEERRGKQAAAGTSEEEEGFQEDTFPWGALAGAWVSPWSGQGQFWYSDHTATQAENLGRSENTKDSQVPTTMDASVGTGRWPWSSILSEYLLQDTCGVIEFNPQTGREGRNKHQEREVIFFLKIIFEYSNLLPFLILPPQGAQLASTLHLLSQLGSEGWSLWISLVLWALPEVLGLISKNVLLCFYTQILSSLPLSFAIWTR